MEKTSSTSWVDIPFTILILFTVCISLLLKTPFAWFILLPLAGIAFYSYKNYISFFSLGYPLMLMVVCVLSGFSWPHFAIIPLLIYLIGITISNTLYRSAHWIHFGRVTGSTAILSVVAIVIVVPSLILLLNQSALDIPAIKSHIPQKHFLLVWLGGIFLAFFTALWEEILFRGVLWDWLSLTFKSSIVVNLLLAGLYAFLYWQGYEFPIVYLPVFFLIGLLCGFFRSHTGGIVAPVGYHFICNVVFVAKILW
jgi:membrane protease YdiL (CAAX protease family)